MLLLYVEKYAERRFFKSKSTPAPKIERVKKLSLAQIWLSGRPKISPGTTVSLLVAHSCLRYRECVWPVYKSDKGSDTGFRTPAVISLCHLLLLLS